MTDLDALFFVTVQLEVRRAGASAGGTGFVVAVDTDADDRRLFVATNHHVVRGAEEIELHLIAADGDGPWLGRGVDVTITDVDRISGHTDPLVDLAVIPIDAELSGDERVFVRYITPSAFHRPGAGRPLLAIEEVVFIGYPNGIRDPVNLTPIARRGITATPPNLDFGGRPAFLVDAAVFPGSSGSPVFLIDRPFDRGGRATDDVDVQLLGVISAGKGHPRRVESTDGGDTDQTTVEMLDLGIVHKASALLELIESTLKRPG